MFLLMEVCHWGYVLEFPKPTQVHWLSVFLLTADSNVEHSATSPAPCLPVFLHAPRNDDQSLGLLSSLDPILTLYLCQPSSDLQILNHTGKLPFPHASSLFTESSGDKPSCPEQPAISGFRSPLTSFPTFIVPVKPESNRYNSLPADIFSVHRVLPYKPSFDEHSARPGKPPLHYHICAQLHQTC